MNIIVSVTYTRYTEEEKVYCGYQTVVGYIPFTMDGTHYLKATN